MPRDGSGQYHAPPGTDGAPDTTIDSAKYNLFVADLEQVLNQPNPIISGGTGGSTPDEALTSLGAEKAHQIVTNFDSMQWMSGSFSAAATATSAPIPGHAFAGIVYVTDASNIVVEARDTDDAAPGALYVRRMKAGSWSAWTLSGSGGGGGGGPALVLVSDIPPVGAADGSLWFESDTGLFFLRYNDGTGPSQWVSIGGTGGASGSSIAVGDTPPPSPTNNELWWKSSNGQLYIYYNDGTSAQWVIAVPTSDPTTFIAKAGDTVPGVIAFAQSPTAPTPPSTDNSANVATTAFANYKSGAVVDSVYAELTAVTNVTVAFPIGSTPPTNTQGSEILTATITPKNTTNKLRVRFQGYAAPAAADNMCGAIFLNAETTARAAQYTASPAAFQQPIILECQFVPGSTSPQTVRVRAGSAGGNITFNANMGGARRATLVVEEIGA